MQLCSWHFLSSRNSRAIYTSWKLYLVPRTLHKWVPTVFSGLTSTAQLVPSNALPGSVFQSLCLLYIPVFLKLLPAYKAQHPACPHPSCRAHLNSLPSTKPPKCSGRNHHYCPWTPWANRSHWPMLLCLKYLKMYKYVFYFKIVVIFCCTCSHPTLPPRC